MEIKCALFIWIEFILWIINHELWIRALPTISMSCAERQRLQYWDEMFATHWLCLWEQKRVQCRGHMILSSTHHRLLPTHPRSVRASPGVRENSLCYVALFGGYSKAELYSLSLICICVPRTRACRAVCSSQPKQETTHCWWVGHVAPNSLIFSFSSDASPAHSAGGRVLP